LSSQSPWIVEGENGWVAAGGCAGGSRIISTNVQVVRNVLVSGPSAEGHELRLHCFPYRTTAWVLVRRSCTCSTAPGYRTDSNTIPAIEQALATPRIHHQLSPNVLAMEVSDASKSFAGFTTAQLSSLSSKGHTVEQVTPTWSNACAITNVRGRLEVSGEPRRLETGGVAVTNPGE
jgi:gamma-glutamyltranspeptidase